MKKAISLLNLQLVRFLIVGIINTGFSYGVYAGLMYLGLNYVAANFLALMLGILFSFRTHGLLVFRNSDNRLFFRFAACWGLIFLVNIGLIYIFMHLGLNAYVAGAVALPIVTVLSYLVQKFLVFGIVTTDGQSKSSKLG